MKKYYKQSLADKVGKIIFWAIWLTLVSLGLYTICKTVNFTILFSNYSLTLNFLERVSGVFIFTLLFIQIILGAYMQELTKRFGSWIFKVHAIQGPVIYLLAIIHPMFLLVFNYKVFHTIDPFYIYTQACLLCKSWQELFYTFGRLAFWFLAIGVLAANWKKLHLINYVVFFFAALHGWFVGSDFHLSPLKFFYWLSIAAVFLTAAREVRLRKEKE